MIYNHIIILKNNYNHSVSLTTLICMPISFLIDKTKENFSSAPRQRQTTQISFTVQVPLLFSISTIIVLIQNLFLH